jgi:hypothetical protein
MAREEERDEAAEDRKGAEYGEGDEAIPPDGSD